MKMRPDQELFDVLEKPLRLLDPIFDEWLSDDGWILLKNNHRHPSRSLRLRGNPEQAIELQLCGNWHGLQITTTPRFELSVNAWMTTDEGIWHLAKTMFSGLDYSDLAPRLSSDLQDAISEVGHWNPDKVIDEGIFCPFFKGYSNNP